MSVEPLIVWVRYPINSSAPIVATILIEIPAPPFAAFLALALSPVIVALSVSRAIAAVAPRVLRTVASTGRWAPPSLRTRASTGPWVLRRGRKH
jgi:hypothetical protein